MDEIQLTFNLTVGLNGLDTNPENPLNRAFRNVLSEGKPHQSHSICFFDTSGRKDRRVLDPRWLGVFVLSRGGRILLFPGLSVPIDWIESIRPGHDPVRRTFELDHFSAEPNAKRWHFTSPRSSDHLAGGRMPSAGDGRLFWFGFSLSEQEVMRVVYAQNLISHQSPPTDTARRIEMVRQLERTTKFTAISSALESKSKFETSFLHLCFVVGPRGAPTYEGPEWLVPNDSPYLIDPLPELIPEANIVLHGIP